MAITLVQTPNPGSSMYSPLWHVASSSNVANTDFRFVFDIYVGGGLILRAKVLPDDNGNGVFDASRIIRAYVANYFAPKVTTEPVTIDTDDIQVEYDIEYGEEYTAGGVSTIYTSLASSTYSGWNAYNSDMPGGGTPYEPLVGRSYTWITSRDLNNIQMPRDGYMFLSYFNGPTQEQHTLEVELLDADGHPTGVNFLTNSALNTTGFLSVLSLNPDDINAADWGTTPPIHPTTPGYRLRLYRADGLSACPWAYVKFMCQPKTQAMPLYFMNRYGGFDTFYFSGPTRRELELERKSMQRIPTYTAGNTIREYNSQTNVYVEGVFNYAQKQTWTRKLVSGYMNDTDSAWLAELLASAQVYILLDPVDYYYFPVTIKTTKWSERLTKFDKMYNLELEITTSRQIISQSR